VVARRAGCKRLLLSHFSARYSRDAGELEAQARAEFDAVTIGKDGMQIEVAYSEQGVVGDRW
jgi:ribonuclease Z